MTTTSFEHEYDIGDEVWPVMDEGFCKFSVPLVGAKVYDIQFSLLNNHLAYITTFYNHSESDLFPTREAAEEEAQRRNDG